MKLFPISDDYLDGKQEGLGEAAKLLEQALARGETMQWAMFHVLEAANKVDAARSMEFDEAQVEFVPRR